MLGSDTVKTISRGLRPVLKDGPIIQFAHQSFVDFLHGNNDSEGAMYLTNNGFRCPKELCIDRDTLLPLLYKFAFLFASRIWESSSINLFDQGNSLFPSRHGEPQNLSYLAKSLFAGRLDQPRDLSDLENMIVSQQQILDLMQDDGRDMAFSLGRSLVIRFASLGHMDNINKAAIHFLRANQLTPNHDPAKPTYVCHLALVSTILRTRSKEISQYNQHLTSLARTQGTRQPFRCTLDIDDAIILLHQAILLLAGSQSPEYLQALQNTLDKLRGDRDQVFMNLGQELARVGRELVDRPVDQGEVPQRRRIHVTTFPRNDQAQESEIIIHTKGQEQWTMFDHNIQEQVFTFQPDEPAEVLTFRHIDQQQALMFQRTAETRIATLTSGKRVSTFTSQEPFGVFMTDEGVDVKPLAGPDGTIAGTRKVNLTFGQDSFLYRYLTLMHITLD